MVVIPILSAVRFTDFVANFRCSPAINRWVIVNRPLTRTNRDVLATQFLDGSLRE
jgi:hypothetical protein